MGIFAPRYCIGTKYQREWGWYQCGRGRQANRIRITIFVQAGHKVILYVGKEKIVVQPGREHVYSTKSAAVSIEAV